MRYFNMKVNTAQAEAACGEIHAVSYHNGIRCHRLKRARSQILAVRQVTFKLIKWVHPGLRMIKFAEF